MASTSHRKCQYRGDGCMGTAHAGHDQCAHCYFQYVKPALQAERAEMKRRRELKRLHLSAENRALINEVDLREPQIVERPDPLSVEEAVKSVVLDNEIYREIDAAFDAGKTPEQTAGEMLLQAALPRALPVLPRRWIAKAPPTKEEMPASDQPPNFRPPLSLDERQEVIDAYVAGMTISEIMRAYNIGTTRLYEALDDAGVPRRGTNRGPNRTFQKEPAMPQSTSPVSPPKVEPASPNGVVSGLTEWVVTYTVTRTETTIVAAKSFNDAAATVTDGDVISVAKKLP